MEDDSIIATCTLASVFLLHQSGRPPMLTFSCSCYGPLHGQRSRCCHVWLPGSAALEGPAALQGLTCRSAVLQGRDAGLVLPIVAQAQQRLLSTEWLLNGTFTQGRVLWQAGSDCIQLRLQQTLPQKFPLMDLAAIPLFSKGQTESLDIWMTHYLGLILFGMFWSTGQNSTWPG